MRLSFFMMFLVGAAHTTACGTDIEDTEGTYNKAITWRQAPGEVQDCHVFKLDNARHVEINRLQVQFPEGSHHVHIYRSSTPMPDAVYDCFKGIDWTQWSLLMGAQTKSMDWQLPEGVTIPLEPHQQILVQVHWLNPTPEPIEPTIDLKFHTTDYSEQHLGVLFGVNQRIEVRPGQDIRVEHFCPVPEGAQLHAVMGHFHKNGHDYRMSERMKDAPMGSGKVLYEAKDEPTFDFKLYNPAYPVTPKMGFEYGCGLFNATGQTITWGSDTQTQEHCNMTAYYAPAEEHKPTLCLNPPSKLTSLEPVEKQVRAGDEVMFVLETAAAEEAPVQIELAVSDATAIELPKTVTIAAGETSAVVTGRALRPAPVDISAYLSGATVTTSVQVTGLVLSELFYQTATGGSSENLQWVEIANQTGTDIDLSKYSLGAGTTDYMRTKMALPSRIVPAGGCVVVSGSGFGPVNHLQNVDIAVDMTPALADGATQAAGIGLFAAPMPSIAPTTRPLDVLVYGGTTNAGLRGPDGSIAPVWSGSAPGGSLRRINDGVWATSTLPTPGNCEVLNAR